MPHKDPQARRAYDRQAYLRRKARLASDPEYRDKTNTYNRNHHRKRLEEDPIYAEHAHLIRRQYLAEHPEARKANGMRHRRKVRAECLRAYGGKCVCCGESAQEFLGIDHVNGDGNKHRREFNMHGGYMFYRWLKKQGYPSGYRVLCHNCNLARGIWGYCPHEQTGRGSSTPLLLTVLEASTLLGISRTSLYRLIDAGVFTPVHIGVAMRIPREALAEYAEHLTAHAGEIASPLHVTPAPSG